MVAIKGWNHGGMVCKLVWDMVLHVMIIRQENHFLLFLPVHREQIALSSHPMLQVFVLAAYPRPLCRNLRALPLPPLLYCRQLRPIHRLFTEKMVLLGHTD